MPDFPDYDDDPGFDEADDYEDDFPDCGMTADGYCTKAGSEECDWDCPFSGELEKEHADA